MRISRYAAFFLLIFMCLYAVIQYQVHAHSMAAERRVELNNAVDRAMDAAIDGIVETVDGYSVVVNREKCANNFYRALYANLGLSDTDEETKELIGVYVPVLAFIDEDGLYVQYLETVNNKTIKTWSPKKVYCKEYVTEPLNENPDSTVQYMVSYTLTDVVTISTAGKVYQGNWKTLQNEYEASYAGEDDAIRGVLAEPQFASDEDFDAERDTVVTNTVVDGVGYYANEHNTIAAKYGESYSFGLPMSAKSELARSIDTVTFLALIQGYPLGRGTKDVYNNFAFGGARVAKNSGYVVSRSADGILRYHNAGCPEITGGRTIYSTKKECALNGAMPCEECKP